MFRFNFEWKNCLKPAGRPALQTLITKSIWTEIEAFFLSQLVRFILSSLLNYFNKCLVVIIQPKTKENKRKEKGQRKGPVQSHHKRTENSITSQKVLVLFALSFLRHFKNTRIENSSGQTIASQRGFELNANVAMLKI